VIVAIGSTRFRQILTGAQPFVAPDVPIFSATKGLESGTRMGMSEIIAEVLTECMPGAISGPNIAHDIIGRLPTGIVVASECSSAVSIARDALQTPTLRIFASSDLRGVELAGALKNVVAIAAGLASGLGLGDNARSLIVALGLVEIQALGTKLGAQAETFIGLAGLGDLFLTSTSVNSRNHMVGVELG
jgi:glycerol-3-phosphate dehydrogenase (NAD(P)+)